MYCKICGAQIKETSHFCPKCGSDLEGNVGLGTMEKPAAQSWIQMNIKNILRGVSLVAAIMFFCPQFMVSCSGQDLEVSMTDIAGGMSASGTNVTDPHPIVFILLLLPIAVLVISFLRNKELMAGFTAIIAGIITVIALFIIKSRVADTAQEYGCTSKALWGFWLYLLSSAAMAVTGIFLVKHPEN